MKLIAPRGVSWNSSLCWMWGGINSFEGCGVELIVLRGVGVDLIDLRGVCVCVN